MCIVVAYYFPPGNVVEEFNDNVGIIEDSIDGVIAETTKPAGIMAEYGQYGGWVNDCWINYLFNIIKGLG